MALTQAIGSPAFRASVIPSEDFICSMIPPTCPVPAGSDQQGMSTVRLTGAGSCTESACAPSGIPGAFAPTCQWGGILPAASGLEYSSRQRECTEFPYAIPLLVDTAIVQKEDCFVECTKPPVLRQAKPGV